MPFPTVCAYYVNAMAHLLITDVAAPEIKHDVNDDPPNNNLAIARAPRSCLPAAQNRDLACCNGKLPQHDDHFTRKPNNLLCWSFFARIHTTANNSMLDLTRFNCVSSNPVLRF